MEALPLALVPLVTAFLAVDNVQQVLANENQLFSISFPLPIGIIDIWTFTNVSVLSASTDGGLTTHLSVGLALLPVVAVVRAALAAGYFGSIKRSFERGGYDFGESVRRFFVPLLVYDLAAALLFLALVGLALVAEPLRIVVVLLGVVGALVLGYLLYAVPYLVVLRDRGLFDAVRRSLELAGEGGPYAHYAIAFLLFGALISVFGSLVVYNIPVFGVVIGAVGVAPLGLALGFATMGFVADIDDDVPSLATWDGEEGGDGEDYGDGVSLHDSDDVRRGDEDETDDIDGNHWDRRDDERGRE